MKKRVGILVLFLMLYSISFVFAADANLRINTALDSVDINGRFNFETASGSSETFDINDLEATTDYSNYSLLKSIVSGTNGLIVDSRTSATNATVLMTLTTDQSQSGEITFSWSYSNTMYPITFYDYGDDSSRTTEVDSFLMSSQSSYSMSDYDGATRYFKLEVGYVAPVTGFCGDGTCNNGETSATCSTDCVSPPPGPGPGGGTCPTTWSSWSSCESGLSTRTRNTVFPGTTSCNVTETESVACCVPEMISGAWSSCSSQGTRTRTNISRLSNCTEITIPESGSCTYQCSESWTCQWGSCQNGFYTPSNCVDSNNCGTSDNKPNAIPCGPGTAGGGAGGSGGGEDCTLNIQCEEWGPCKVETTFEDVKNPNSIVDGMQTRKCLDANNCLVAPYFEEQACSVKVLTESKKVTVCGEEYLEIYESGTDYLLARIKDDRNSVKRALNIFFYLGGKAEEVPCEKPLLGIYSLNVFDKIMVFFDLRNVGEAIREK